MIERISWVSVFGLFAWVFWHAFLWALEGPL